MKYEWEDQARSEYIKAVYRGGYMPRHLRIIAIAVENTDTGEAALIILEEPDGSVIDADCWQDVLGDANRHYAMSREMMSIAFADRRAGGDSADG